MKQQLKRGLLISIEGIDGCGKSILCKNLGLELSKKYAVFVTKEPGGSNLGKELREILQNKKVCPLSEFLLYAADRAQHFSEFVIPALKENKLVISDRMADSSLAYQGYGRNLDLEFIEKVNKMAMQSIEPDLTLYLQIDVQTARNRINRRKLKLTVMEREEINFMQKVKDAFEIIFENRKNVKTINAQQSEEQVLKNTLNIVEEWIEKQKLV